MPLISRGSLDRFTGVARDPQLLEQGLTGPRSFSVFREVTRAMQPVPLRLARSASPPRIELVDIRLDPDSRVMLRQVSAPDRPVYVLGWWWDLAGGGPVVVPPEPGAAECALKLDGDGIRRLAHPVTLSEPGRPVVGGLVVRVILWQGEQGTDPARVTAEVAEAMRHSTLGGMLGMLASAADTTMATVIAVRQAAAALGPEIAPVLRALCTDYIDFFEGFYPADEAVGDREPHEGFQSALAVRTTVG